MKYDIILLDADETLFDFDQSEYNALKHCFKSRSLEFSDEIYNGYHNINKKLWKDFEKGKIEKPKLVTERFRILLSDLGYSIDPAEFNLSYGEALSRQNILFPGALRLCRRLAQNARLYIVTNGIKATQLRRFSESPLPPYIEDVFVSEEIGSQKPSRQYFDAVFSRIPDFDQSRAIIVGDSLSSDIKGGMNAGIASCWYNPNFLPNMTDVVPTYTAQNYDDIEKIICGNCRRAVPHGTVAVSYEHTNKKALVLMPADEKIRKNMHDAAPDFSLIFADLKNDAVPELASECEVVIGQAPVKYLQKSEKLRFVQLCIAGTEPYSEPGILPENVYLTNATGAFGLAVSEHMLASLLCLYKKLHLYRDNMRNRSWIDRGGVKTLNGAVVLVLGLGNIGSGFAKMVYDLGAYTIGVKRTAAEKPEYIDELVSVSSLDRVLHKADVVAMALPSTKETVGIMSEKRIFSMKDGAVLINAGRGNALDSDALAEALMCGKLGAAALDVTDPEPLPKEHPLWKCENALITPHVSGYYHLKNTLDSVAEICTENLRRYANGEKLRNIVNKEIGYAEK